MKEIGSLYLSNHSCIELKKCEDVSRTIIIIDGDIVMGLDSEDMARVYYEVFKFLKGQLPRAGIIIKHNDNIHYYESKDQKFQVIQNALPIISNLMLLEALNICNYLREIVEQLDKDRKLIYRMTL